MAKFFVSYSRSDKDEVSKIVSLLSAAGHEVWWDNDIPVISDWWGTILAHIEWCQVFIFVSSEKSVQSDYCLAELKYADERQRPILPFMLQDPSNLRLPSLLPRRNQWLIYDGDPARMLSQVNIAFKNIDWSLHKDIYVPRPPEPKKGGKSLAQQFQEARRLANEERFDEAKTLFRDVKRIDVAEWGEDCDTWLGRVTNYEQIVDLVKDSSTLDHAREAWKTYMRLYGESFDPYPVKPLLVIPPTKSNRGSVIALALGGAAILFLFLTIRTLSGSGTATIVPTFTERIASTPTQLAAVTFTPSDLHSSTLPPIDTEEEETAASQLPTQTSEIAPYAEQLSRFDYRRGNETWTPIEQEFDSVAMVLVPNGCFMMGSSEQEIAALVQRWLPGVQDERPMHQICFNEPFWIDKYEVNDSRQPIQLSWTQARDYCEARRTRLPTEPEWEYAARGPSDYIYPWGDQFFSEYIAWKEWTGYSVQLVGRIQAGASWVGAMDMAGNLAEWVSTRYGDQYPYPYIATDGREDPSSDYRERSLRGGGIYSEQWEMRSAYRGHGLDGESSGTTRCVRNA